MSTDNESPIILTAAEQEGLDLPDDFGDEIITSDNEGHDDFAMDDDDEEIEITIDDEEVAPVVPAPEPVIDPVVENTGIDYAEVLLASTTKQAELEAQLKDLATKFDDCEMYYADYNIEVRKIERALPVLKPKWNWLKNKLKRKTQPQKRTKQSSWHNGKRHRLTSLPNLKTKPLPKMMRCSARSSTAARRIAPG